MMNRRTLTQSAAALAAAWLPWHPAALAAEEAPDALVKRLSADVLDTLRNDKSIKSGDVDKIIALVDKTIMPHVNFRRMTAAAVGPAWRKATPEHATFQARVTLELENRYLFPKDSSLKILTSGLLGDQYIGIEPGADEHNLASGDLVTATQSAVVLENLIGQFLYSKAEENAAPAGAGGKK